MARKFLKRGDERGLICRDRLRSFALLSPITRLFTLKATVDILGRISRDLKYRSPSLPRSATGYGTKKPAIDCLHLIVVRAGY